MLFFSSTLSHKYTKCQFYSHLYTEGFFYNKFHCILYNDKDSDLQRDMVKYTIYKLRDMAI